MRGTDNFMLLTYHSNNTAKNKGIEIKMTRIYLPCLSYEDPKNMHLFLTLKANHNFT